jgi:retron-type reverse transcriptase
MFLKGGSTLPVLWTTLNAENTTILKADPTVVDGEQRSKWRTKWKLAKYMSRVKKKHWSANKQGNQDICARELHGR